MSQEEAPKFVMAVFEHLPEEWSQCPSPKESSCLWMATPPGWKKGELLACAPIPPVDRWGVAATRHDPYKLLHGLPDKVLGYYVKMMRDMANTPGEPSIEPLLVTRENVDRMLKRVFEHAIKYSFGLPLEDKGDA